MDLAYDQEPEAPSPEEIKSQLATFSGKLQRLAEEQVAQRAEIEKRWIEDLYQLSGQYDPETAARLDADETRSKAYVNITRPKTNTIEARLLDMLFPTDDKNWGIQPTPVPELSEAMASSQPAVDPKTGQPTTLGDMAQQEVAEAKKRAERMAVVIDDQLKEARYNMKSRDMIQQACRLGTGVIKAPIVVGQARRAWNKQGVASTGTEVYALDYAEEKRPSAEWVDVWNFFPDMSAPTIDDADFIFERHYYTKKDVRKLLKQPGFHAENVRELLKQDPAEHRSTNSHVDDLRRIAGLTGVSDENRYEIWEYHGPVDTDILYACGCDVDPDDPIQEIEGVVWFCGPTLLKAVVNPMESESRPYSVFCLEKDDASIFGFGVPYLLRHVQRVVNAAWRMILENGGLAVGPQIVLNQKLVQPVDGNYNIYARKVWTLLQANADARTAFATFDIPSRQGELLNILQTALQLADQESSTPLIAQGEMGQQAPNMPGVTMSMLMNSANAVTRRAVKNYDDDITSPVIQRFYDWNMQFNPKNDIKGDFETVARGTSALLVKEQQQQALMQFLQLTGNAVDMPMTNRVELLRQVAKSLHLSEEDAILSDEQIQAMQQQQAQAAQQQAQAAQQGNPQQLQIEQMKLQAQMQMHREKLADAQAERQSRLQERMIEREIATTKLAIEQQISIEQINAKLKESLMTNQIKRQNFVDEANLKIRQGQGI